MCISFHHYNQWFLIIWKFQLVSMCCRFAPFVNIWCNFSTFDNFEFPNMLQIYFKYVANLLLLVQFEVFPLVLSRACFTLLELHFAILCTLLHFASVVVVLLLQFASLLLCTLLVLCLLHFSTFHFAPLCKCGRSFTLLQFQTLPNCCRLSAAASTNPPNINKFQFLSCL